jgi:diacylglycerol kinase (ATP)
MNRKFPFESQCVFFWRGNKTHRNLGEKLAGRGAMLAWLSAEGVRFRNTVIWSWQGWLAAWETEKTLRQWTIVHGLSVGLALALEMSPAERGLIIGMGFLVLAAELMNTGLEEVVDHLSPHLDPRAKKAKDCGSAAVALTAIAAGACWLVVLIG